VRRLTAAIVLAVLTAPPAALAQDGPVASVFAESEGAAYLTYFIEECGGECPVAQFTCADPHNIGVGLMLPDFEGEDIARWLTENGGAATLRFPSSTIEFVARQMNFSEMSGMWDVSLGSWDSDASALEPLALAEAGVIVTPKGEIALPALERDSANARAFIDACLRGG
jgi:hypothetical protein